MNTAEFIKELGDSFSDPNYQLFSQEDWKDVINFQLKDIAGDVKIQTTTEVTYDSSTLQVDISGDTYDNLISVDSVLLETSNGRIVEFDNWTWLPGKKVVDMDPDVYKDADRNIDDYSKTYIVWSHYADELDDENDTIPVNNKNVGLLKKLCKKEALSRLLMDKVKFKRYQVYAGQVSHFFVLGLIKELDNEIEREKMLQKDNSIDTF